MSICCCCCCCCCWCCSCCWHCDCYNCCHWATADVYIIIIPGCCWCFCPPSVTLLSFVSFVAEHNAHMNAFIPALERRTVQMANYSMEFSS